MSLANAVERALSDRGLRIDAFPTLEQHDSKLTGEVMQGADTYRFIVDTEERTLEIELATAVHYDDWLVDRECSQGYSCGSSCISKKKACLKSLTADQKKAVQKLKGSARVALSQEFQAANAEEAAASEGATEQPPGSAAAADFTPSIESFTAAGEEYFSEELATLRDKVGKLETETVQVQEKWEEALANDEELKELQAAKDAVPSGSRDEFRDAVAAISQRNRDLMAETLSEEEIDLLNDGDDLISEAYTEFAASLLARSPISDEQAAELASNIETLAVSDSFRALAEEQGLNVDLALDEAQIKEAITDYIKLNAVTDAAALPSSIEEATDGRSFFDINTRSVHLDNASGRDVFFHEMTHTLESTDSELFELGVAYRESRATSSEAQKLSDITGVDYRESEVALEGDYYEPYMGKVYGEGVQHTEVLSMAIELFGDATRPGNETGWDPEGVGGENLRNLANDDPELFAIAVGVIARRQQKAGA